jgi:hypothetical protein
VGRGDGSGGGLLETQLTGIDNAVVQGAALAAKEVLTFGANAELTADDGGAGGNRFALEA